MMVEKQEQLFFTVVFGWPSDWGASQVCTRDDYATRLRH